MIKNLPILLIIALCYMSVDSRNINRRYSMNREMGDPSKIINGTIATEHQFPYQALFTADYKECGASIIAPNVAMTAGHCCDAIALSDMDVHAGGIDLSTFEGMQTSPVKMYFQHPSFSIFPLEYDICILHLVNDFDLSDGSVGVIKLAPFNQNSDHYIGMAATITGWGSFRYSDRTRSLYLTPNLRYGEVTIWSDQQCSNSLYGVEEDILITPEKICAGDGDPDLHISYCGGDQGGPMALGDADTPWEDREQVGIMSWSQGCAEDGYPGVYTDVAYLRDWIDLILEAE